MKRNLYFKIFFVALIPILLITIINFSQIEYFTQKQLQTIENTNAIQRTMIENRLNKTLTLIQRDLDILTNAYEVVEAVKYNDNDVLSIWGKKFLSTNDKIIFIDIHGVIISRAHDEFKFGDTLEPEFLNALQDNEYYSALKSIDDTQLALLKAKPIKQYGELVVGYIIIAKNLNSAFINEITKGTNYTITTSNKETLFPIHLNNITYNEGTLGFELINNTQEKDLESIKTNILFYTLLLISVLIISLYQVIKKHLIAYSDFAQIVEHFTDDKITIKELIKQSDSFTKKHRKHEISAISNTVHTMAKQIDKTQSNLELLSQTDALTNISNRRKLNNILNDLTRQALRYHTHFSIMIIDIDHFKNINDEFGHQAGDEVLKKLANELSSHIRESDYFGRYGGEEFVIICPNSTSIDTILLAEKLRASTQNTKFCNDINVTISIGVAEFNEHSLSLEELIRQADKNLYKAKRMGRNQVIG